MSGPITLTTVATAVSAAAAAASAGLAISNAVGGPAAGAADGLASALGLKSQEAAQQRSSLLATAGQAAGSPLAPGGVSPTGNLFGN